MRDFDKNLIKCTKIVTSICRRASHDVKEYVLYTVTGIFLFWAHIEMSISNELEEIYDE